jgi:hypothetical protein
MTRRSTQTKMLWLCMDCLMVVPETAAMRAQFEQWWATDSPSSWPSLLYCPMCFAGQLLEAEEGGTRALALATQGVGGVRERFEAARAAGCAHMLRRHAGGVG